MTMHSATLAIDEQVRHRREAGQSVLHLGFGEAGLPVPASLMEIFAAGACRNSYGPVVGWPQAREAAAGWFSRRGLSTDPQQIVFGPGSKPLLFALVAAIGGDVVLPEPAWVSYAAQATLLNRRVIPVPIPRRAGGVPDPALLDDALHRAQARGARPGVLVLTIPDNPTGTVAWPSDVEAVCMIAERHGLAIIVDEIYAELCHDGSAPRVSHYLPDRTVVTSGLSKSLSLGGWRIGFARSPASDWGQQLIRDLTGVASEIWSSLASPMQVVAGHVLNDPADILEHIAAARRLHARIASAVYDEFMQAGAICRRPQAGFYLYPDFEPVKAALGSQGIRTSTELARTMLDRHGIAVLSGHAFGESDMTLTVRVATSLLYGTTTEERWAALTAPEPEKLPWITDALAVLRRELHTLTGR
ncbi:MAG: pyridoxal phosphate-dependent aminotransferase [Actinomycetota bacterium]|nr:pyridoxal phosphate-dependent aminotransferase [Actinomycetota bacterium]